MKQHPLFAHLRPLNGAWGDITTAVGSPQIGFVLAAGAIEGCCRQGTYPAPSRQQWRHMTLFNLCFYLQFCIASGSRAHCCYFQNSLLFDSIMYAVSANFLASLVAFSSLSAKYKRRNEFCMNVHFRKDYFALDTERWIAAVLEYAIFSLTYWSEAKLLPTTAGA